MTDLNTEFGNSAASSFSTQKGRKVALKHYDTFAFKTKRKCFAEFCEAELTDEKTFRSLADFLCSHTYNLDLNGDEIPFELARTTAQQYFSSIKESIKEKYPTAPIFMQNVEDKWRSEILTEMDKLLSRRCKERGEVLMKKAPAIGRRVLRDVASALLKNTSQVDKSAMRRLAIVTTFLAVGRAGELRDVSLKLCKWDHDRNCLEMEWQCPKTYEQKTINFVSDREWFELDFYHAYACYMLMSKHDNRLDWKIAGYEFFISELGKLSEGETASKISSYLQDHTMTSKDTVYDKVPDLPDNVTGKSLRTGSICLLSSQLTTHHIHQRSGHKEDQLHVGSSNVKSYLNSSDIVAITEAGACLAGHVNSKQAVVQPTMSWVVDKCIMAEHKESFEKTLYELQSHLFSLFLCDRFEKSNQLKPLGDCMLASLLMYLDDFERKYGRNHPILQRLYTVCAANKIKRDQLLEWGYIINNNWINFNLPKMAHDLSPLTQSINFLVTQIPAILSQNELLRMQVLQQNVAIDEIKSTLRKFVDSESSVCESCTTFKRRRVSAVVDSPITQESQIDIDDCVIIVPSTPPVVPSNNVPNSLSTKFITPTPTKAVNMYELCRTAADAPMVTITGTTSLSDWLVSIRTTCRSKNVRVIYAQDVESRAKQLEKRLLSTLTQNDKDVINDKSVSIEVITVRVKTIVKSFIKDLKICTQWAQFMKETSKKSEEFIRTYKLPAPRNTDDPGIGAVAKSVSTVVKALNEYGELLKHKVYATNVTCINAIPYLKSLFPEHYL